MEKMNQNYCVLIAGVILFSNSFLLSSTVANTQDESNEVIRSEDAFNEEEGVRRDALKEFLIGSDGGQYSEESRYPQDFDNNSVLPLNSSPKKPTQKRKITGFSFSNLAKKISKPQQEKMVTPNPKRTYSFSFNDLANRVRMVPTQNTKN